MIYVTTVTVPANTPPDDPVTTEFEVEGWAIREVQILVPPGHCGLTGIALFYGIRQIIPRPEGSWLVTDDEIVTWPENRRIPLLKATYTIKAYNQDDTYEHTFYIRFVVQSVEEYLEEHSLPWWYEEE